MRWAGHAARMDENRKECFQILTGKPIGKSPLGRPRCRWEDSIRMDLKEVGFSSDGDYWQTLVNTALNLWVP